MKIQGSMGNGIKVLLAEFTEDTNVIQTQMSDNEHTVFLMGFSHIDYASVIALFEVCDSNGNSKFFYSDFTTDKVLTALETDAPLKWFADKVNELIVA